MKKFHFKKIWYLITRKKVKQNSYQVDGIIPSSQWHLARNQKLWSKSLDRVYFKTFANGFKTNYIND